MTTSEETSEEIAATDSSTPATAPSSATAIRLLLAAGLAAWIASSIAGWLAAAPLGHDEAQYANSAKDLIAGAPVRQFYLSRGMAYVAAPGVLAGGSEVAMRFVPMLFGLGFVLSVWAIARRAFGAATAAWTVAVLAGARSYIKVSSELLSDMTAAACLLAATAVILGELRASGGTVAPPRWRALLAAPLLAAALYLRYASCVPIAFLGVGWLVAGWRGIVRRPGPIVATAALFLLLCVPHARSAIELTGSPLGLLLESSRVVPNDFVGQGLTAYLTRNPFVFYGLLMPPVLIAGLVALRPNAGRAVFLLWPLALASIAVIALITQAHARYILFGTALLSILGVEQLRRLAERLTGRAGPRARQVVAACAVIAVATTWVLVFRAQLRQGAVRSAGTTATLLASQAIRADAAGRPCLFLGQHYTQLEWYSGCPTAEVEAYPPPGVLLYVVRDRTPGWQPPAELPGGPGRRAQILDVPGLVNVERVEAVR